MVPQHFLTEDYVPLYASTVPRPDGKNYSQLPIVIAEKAEMFMSDGVKVAQPLF